MSFFHTKPIYPKQQNIGMVLWATVSQKWSTEELNLINNIGTPKAPKKAIQKQMTVITQSQKGLRVMLKEVIKYFKFYLDYLYF